MSQRQDNALIYNSAMDSTLNFNTRKNMWTRKTWMETTSDLLVPGDILAVPNNNFEMPCDAVLLEGHVLVSE